MFILVYLFVWSPSWFPWWQVAVNSRTTMWLSWSHHCIYITIGHLNVMCDVPKHLNSPFSSVLGCPRRFPRKIDVRFGSCFIYVISIYFRILVSNTISCGAWSVDPSGAPLLCSGVHVVLSLVFCIMFYGSLFVLYVIFRLSFVLYFLLWFTASDYLLWYGQAVLT